jgi:hypothetical protein
MPAIIHKAMARHQTAVFQTISTLCPPEYGGHLASTPDGLAGDSFYASRLKTAGDLAQRLAPVLLELCRYAEGVLMRFEVFLESGHRCRSGAFGRVSRLPTLTACLFGR